MMAEFYKSRLKWRFWIYFGAWLISGLVFIQSDPPFDMTNRENLLTTIVGLIFLLPSFFILPFYLIPFYLYRGKYKQFFFILILVLIFCVALYVIGSRLGYHLIRPDFSIFPEQDEVFLRLHLAVWHIILCFALSLGIKVVLDKEATENNLILLQTEGIRSELNFLKTQLNPFFMISVMHILKENVTEEKDQVREIVDTLDNVLKYQVEECNQNLIIIDSELKYLLSYINVQKKRLEDESIVTLNLSEDIKGFYIVPLLVMPLIENAFKYISHHSDQSKNIIDILMEYRPSNRFYVSIYNTFDENVVKIKQKRASGVGLTNLKRRLALLYPGEEILQVSAGARSFHATLNLPVYQTSEHELV